MLRMINSVFVAALTAAGICSIALAAENQYTALITWEKTPFNPTIARFTLIDRSCATAWSIDHFGQNAYWISAAGTVVALRSPGDEGLPGTLSFYDGRGNVVRQAPVRGFSGGRFCPSGTLFFACDLTNGLSAYDARGARAWSLPIGDAYEPSDDGGTVAIARNRAIGLYAGGALRNSMPWAGGPVRGMAFSGNGSTLAVISAANIAVYDIQRAEMLWHQAPAGYGREFVSLASDRGDGFATVERDRTGNERECRWAVNGAMLADRVSPANAPAMMAGSGNRTRPKNAACWPLGPIDHVHPLGNGWGEYQNYSYPPDPAQAYFHPGIDVMALTDSGVPVYAVAHGWVKAWLTTSAQWHWRLAIADSGSAWTDSSDGWLYAHIDAARAHKNIGDEVFPGDQIGYLVVWPVSGFDHCHFARIRDAGATWNAGGADWAFIDDPLNLISPTADSAGPVFEDALPGYRFAFCANNDGAYLDPGSLQDDVDIVARIYDRFGQGIAAYSDWEKLNPYRIDYRIHGQSASQAQRLSFLFGHRLDWDNVELTSMVFKQDAACTTYGDYDSRQYYYVVTNSDGDSLLETSDAGECWHTGSFPNGTYWVIVTATDQSGNATSDSQQVVVNNVVGISGLARPGKPGLPITYGPNPFRDHLTLNVQAAHDRDVDISVYNAAGQLVRKLINDHACQDVRTVHWDGNDQSGRQVASGCYLLRIITGTATYDRKVLRIR